MASCCGGIRKTRFVRQQRKESLGRLRSPLCIPYGEEESAVGGGEPRQRDRISSGPTCQHKSATRSESILGEVDDSTGLKGSRDRDI